MRIIRLVEALLSRAVSAALVVLFIVMTLLAMVQVFLRYFFNAGIPWADIAARELVMWVGILGAVLATKEDKHFQIDVLTRFLAQRKQKWFRSFSDFVAGVVCYFLGKASLTFLGIDAGETTFLNIPVVIVELIIPVGFYLLMVQFGFRSVINLVEGFRAVNSNEHVEAP
jgi:TRAP-type C4-dicarboxylate transport system permease small subunit